MWWLIGSQQSAVKLVLIRFCNHQKDKHCTKEFNGCGKILEFFCDNYMIFPLHIIFFGK